MSNHLAPDGYRYGVMFQDGSVSQRWNGRTQKAQATWEAASIKYNQLMTVGRVDNIRVVRRRSSDEDWEEVA